jgi:glycosyltransferase involved in cell wall biosynthesis
MSLPKISIVTPSFNQAQFLDETIRSVLDQNYENLEYVVIDGGSTDRSVEIIQKYESQLAYWVSEPDDGHAHAINKGFAHTTGEIMAWINSDDKYTPWAFDAASDIFEQFPDVDWIVGFNSYWNIHGAMTYAWRQPKNIYDYLLGNLSWVQQESVFWRRSLWEKSGGKLNQDYRLAVDGELWTRFFLHAELYSVDCVLAGYRIHSDNRAIQFHEECVLEMKTAIAEMSKHCSGDTLETYKKLRRLQRLEKIPILRHVPIQYLLHQSIWSELYESLGYKRIVFTDGKWIEDKLPWSIH